MSTKRIIVDLSHGRQPEGKIFDSTGHGYSVYYNGISTFIQKFLNAASCWGGHTNTYEINGEEYKYYELSFEDYDLFLNSSIHRILQKNETTNDMEIIILKTTKEAFNFFRKK